jgi:hypothetical protein
MWARCAKRASCPRPQRVDAQESAQTARPRIAQQFRVRRRSRVSVPVEVECRRGEAREVSAGTERQVGIARLWQATEDSGTGIRAKCTQHQATGVAVSGKGVGWNHRATPER